MAGEQCLVEEGERGGEVGEAMGVVELGGEKGLSLGSLLLSEMFAHYGEPDKLVRLVVPNEGVVVASLEKSGREADAAVQFAVRKQRVFHIAAECGLWGAGKC